MQRIPFLHQELALGKSFSKCYNYGATAFFAQATPEGWGGLRNFFHARNVSPPPNHHTYVTSGGPRFQNLCKDGQIMPFQGGQLDV